MTDVSLAVGEPEEDWFDKMVDPYARQSTLFMFANLAGLRSEIEYICDLLRREANKDPLNAVPAIHELSRRLMLRSSEEGQQFQQIALQLAHHRFIRKVCSAWTWFSRQVDRLYPRLPFVTIAPVHSLQSAPHLLDPAG